MQVELTPLGNNMLMKKNSTLSCFLLIGISTVKLPVLFVTQKWQKLLMP